MRIACPRRNRRIGRAVPGYPEVTPDPRNAVFRALRCLAVVVAGLAACGSPAAVEPGPLVYEIDGFRIEDHTRRAPRDLIDSIAAALEVAVADVTAFLPEFPPFAGTITFEILEGGGIAVVMIGELRISQYENDLAIEYLPHHLTHLLTGYARRAFLEEGIAVYATEVLDPASTITNPYRGQPPHAWVSLFQQHGSTIPLATALAATNVGYDYEGSTADASAWQVFIEAASFTRWVIATFGRQAWLDWYVSDNLAGTLALSLADLEEAWLRAARISYPDPLPCETALSTRGPLGTREALWCARARGE
jgi:hypothetical protein